MDLVRGHGGGGRGAQRPAVEFVAVRARPHAGVHRRAWRAGPAARPAGARAPGRSSAGRWPGRGRAQSPGMSLVRRSRQFDQPAAFASALDAHRHLGDRLVDQEGGGDQPLRGRVLQPAELAVELDRHSFRAGRDRLRRRRHSRTGWSAVEEARHVEIGADILDHDIGRVAPAADRDVAIGQGEAVERGAIGRLRTTSTLVRVEWVSAAVSTASARARSARSVAASRVLSGLAAVGELASGGGARAGVDAEAGRAFRRQGEQILADRVEQRGDVGFARRVPAAKAARRRQGNGGDAGRKGAERLAARETEVVHSR